MLLAVEGGGFFSSSASGYSHGLALLLLGRKTEDKTIKASPWSQYCLVEGGAQHEYQLAPKRNHFKGKCASFTCFGCRAAGLDKKSPPRLIPSIQPEKQPESPSCSGKKLTLNGDNNGSARKGCLKSNLNRNTSENSVLLNENEGTCDSVEEMQSINPIFERRNVHWTDTYGQELAEIREFEASDNDSSDEELEIDGFKKCECVIQ